MATISISGDMLSIRLTRRERIAAAQGDLHVPLAAVRDVRVHLDAFAAARGVRAPAIGVRGVAKLGIARGRGRRYYVVARRGTPAVCVRLDGGRHDKIIVSDPNAEAIASEIRAAALATRRAA